MILSVPSIYFCLIDFWRGTVIRCIRLNIAIFFYFLLSALHISITCILSMAYLCPVISLILLCLSALSTMFIFSISAHIFNGFSLFCLNAFVHNYIIIITLFYLPYSLQGFCIVCCLHLVTSGSRSSIYSYLL